MQVMKSSVKSLTDMVLFTMYKVDRCNEFCWYISIRI